MNLKRIWRHVWMNEFHLRRCFSEATLNSIRDAVARSEATHRGQIRFVVESELAWRPLLSGLTPRARALEVFSLQRIWDTEENNGVLIYVLLADRCVEVIADRGIHRQVGDAGWNYICKEIEKEFRKGKFEAGVTAGIEAVAAHLRKHFPSCAPSQNEIPDEPVVL